MITIIRTIPHGNQRYDTVGDWTESSSGFTITVSQMCDRRHEWLVAIHELVEAVLCQAAGITQEQVDEFDMAWERNGQTGEPGDSPDAPYFYEHQTASRIEKILALVLKINWNDYEAAVDAL